MVSARHHCSQEEITIGQVRDWKGMDKEEWKFVKKKKEKKENGKENKEEGVIKNNWGRGVGVGICNERVDECVCVCVYKYVWDSFLVRSVFFFSFFFLHAYSNFKTFSSRRFVPRKLSPTS